MQNIRLHREQWELYLDEFVEKHVQGTPLKLFLRSQIHHLRADAKNVVTMNEVRRALTVYFGDFWKQYKTVLENLRPPL